MPCSAGNPGALADGAGGLGVGLVGLGYWGPNHLRVLQESDQTELRWICDSDADRVGMFSRRTAATAATSLDGVLSDPRTEAVIIATPISTHFDLACQSLEAGKHVLVEKPLAASSEEADELIGLAESMGLVLMCAHTFLYSPPVRAIRDLIARGALGELHFISSSRVNLGLHQRDVSVLWDLGPHDFSILLSWLGSMPTSVSAVGRDSIVPGTPDVAFVNLAFDRGPLVNVELSWLAPSKLRRTVVVGSEKMVVYEDGIGEPLRIFDHGVDYREPGSFGEFQLSYRTGDIVSPKLDAEEPLASQLNAFVAAVRDGHPAPHHLDLAREVVGLVEACQLSLQEEGQRIHLRGLRGAEL